MINHFLTGKADRLSVFRQPLPMSFNCIIRYHKGVFTHLKEELIKKLDNFVCSNTISRCKALFRELTC